MTASMKANGGPQSIIDGLPDAFAGGITHPGPIPPACHSCVWIFIPSEMQWRLKVAHGQPPHRCDHAEPDTDGSRHMLAEPGQVSGHDAAKRAHVIAALCEDASRLNHVIAVEAGVNVQVVVDARAQLVGRKQLHAYDGRRATTGARAPHSDSCWCGGAGP